MTVIAEWNRLIVRRFFLSGRHRFVSELRCLQANPARQKHHTDRKDASIKTSPPDMRLKAWFVKLSNTHIQLDKKCHNHLVFMTKF